MIGRKSTGALAELYAWMFRKAASRSSYGSSRTSYGVNSIALYDFLYDNDYCAWFCNHARKVRSTYTTRPLKDFIMKVHTGESLTDGTPGWTWAQREKLGQRYLRDLAEDLIARVESDDFYDYKGQTSEITNKLIRLLELDGYLLRNGELLAPEEDVVDVEKEQSLLSNLYSRLSLKQADIALHHLELSEQHYITERWDDSIANSRKFFEAVLTNVAKRHGDVRGQPFSESDATRPVRVRDYLERVDLLETKEKEAIAKVYGLLSHTGGHPYMAQNDQARLLRHLALTLSQFVMLRLEGSLTQSV